jgi:hypothetical protein
MITTSNFCFSSFYVDYRAENGDFMSFLSEKMSDDGVLVAQVGEAPWLDDPAKESSVKKYRSNFIHSLKKYDFLSIVDYEEVRQSTEC